MSLKDDWKIPVTKEEFEAWDERFKDVPLPEMPDDFFQDIWNELNSETPKQFE